MNDAQEAPSNGLAEPRIDISTGLYPFDAAEVNVPLRLETGAIVTHVWRKPTLKDHLQREESMNRVAKGLSRTEFVNESKQKQANAEFYDAVIQRAEGKATINRDGEDKEITEQFDQARCLSFGFETKDKVVTEAYLTPFEVVPEDNSPFAALFDREGTIRIKQEIGNEFVIFYILKVPSEGQRTEFGQSVQVKEKFEKKNRRSLITTVNLNKGVKIFGALLDGVEGGMVQGQPYSSELRKEFLANIDPLFQYLVVDTAVSSFDPGRD